MKWCFFNPALASPIGEGWVGLGKKKWSRIGGTTRILKYEPTFYKLSE
jgi:hypothetical protein